MDSGTACRRVPAGLSSVPAAGKDASASPREVASLRRATDFRRVLSHGTRSRRGAVTVAAFPGIGAQTRVGLVVRRNVGNAVRRNRAKRRIRHALMRIPLEQGMDYVIIAGPRVVEVGFDRLVEWLDDAVGDLR
jgi:ribonuclease P protein component